MKKKSMYVVIIAVIILILLICDYLDPLTVLSKKTGAFINVENWTTFLIGIFTVIGAYFGGIIVNDNIHKKNKIQQLKNETLMDGTISILEDIYTKGNAETLNGKVVLYISSKDISYRSIELLKSKVKIYFRSIGKQSTVELKYLYYVENCYAIYNEEIVHVNFGYLENVIKKISNILGEITIENQLDVTQMNKSQIEVITFNVNFLISNNTLDKILEYIKDNDEINVAKDNIYNSLNEINSDLENNKYLEYILVGIMGILSIATEEFKNKLYNITGEKFNTFGEFAKEINLIEYNNLLNRLTPFIEVVKKEMPRLIIRSNENINIMEKGELSKSLYDARVLFGNENNQISNNKSDSLIIINEETLKELIAIIQD